MMPIGLVPGAIPWALGWRHQEVHHCVNEVATLAILWVCNRTRMFRPYIYGCSTIPVKQIECRTHKTIQEDECKNENQIKERKKEGSGTKEIEKDLIN